jgi:hypothetical protein
LWLKDTRYGAGLSDEAGSPAFALVNKATGEALKHSFGHCSPVSHLLRFRFAAISPNLRDDYRN